MIRRAAPLGCLFSVLVSPAAPAQPQVGVIRAVPIAPVGFDLSRDVSGGRAAGNERLHPLVAREEWRQSNVPQALWTYHPADKGPQLEVAAFGAGSKGMPSLAHVGVDWNF